MRLIRLDPDREERAAVRNLRFHPTRPLLAAVVGDPDHFRELCRYRLDTDAPLATPQPDEMDGYVPIENGPDPVASNDLELVATSVLAFDGVPAVVVIDTWSRDRQEFCFTSDDEQVTFPALAFSAVGSHLYAATSDARRGGKLVRVWNLEALFDDDAADAEEEPFDRPPDLAADDLPTALATDPAGKFVVVGTSAGAVWLFDARREEPPYRLAPVRGGVRTLQFVADGRTMLVVAAGGVTLLNARTGTTVIHWRGAYSAASVSPDGRRAALVDAAGTLTMSDVATGEVLARYDAGAGPLSGVAFAPDGLTCAVGGAGGVVVVFDV